ncbi:MAG: lipoprotein LpqH [Mycobacterium sp.]|uniref:lipoprotein LpqH n=1 Tax=Mycobacterium sp. TaxID=1785 RepID=UPI001ED1C7FA|nr:lipoprotein LpqH [Mycobacterium sp.]MBW0017113.1 lipoprotein LpqH [Mycobacterium sp.]
MRDRIAAAGAVALAVILSACGPPSQAQIASTAVVTVNGVEAKMSSVRCSQLEWTRTIDIGGQYSGATAVIDEHAEPITARSVRIRNMGNFTGMYSQGGDGDASATLTNDTFAITGTANGSKADKTNEPMTATFKISAKC